LAGTCVQHQLAVEIVSTHDQLQKAKVKRGATLISSKENGLEIPRMWIISSLMISVPKVNLMFIIGFALHSSNEELCARNVT
jgi:hypothetical protein